MGLLGVVVAAHINSVCAAIGIHALQLHGLVGQAVRHVQHFFNAVDIGVAGVGNAYQQDFAAHIFQAVIAAAGGAGRVAQFLRGVVVQ